MSAASGQDAGADLKNDPVCKDSSHLAGEGGLCPGLTHKTRCYLGEILVETSETLYECLVNNTSE